MMSRRRDLAKRNPTQTPKPQPVHRVSLKQLRRAHKMMEIGQHQDAARIFNKLAHQAEDRGRLRVAPNLYFQAGRSFLLAGEPDQGAQLLEYGLKILSKKEKWSALIRASSRIIQELERFGYPTISQTIARWSDDTIPSSFIETMTSEKITSTFPLKCPDCLGVLHPGDLTILDVGNTECPFCGVGIQALQS